MASIRQRGGRWQARVTRRGHLPETKTFDTKEDAAKWARGVESEIDRGVFVSIKEAERTTLADILLRYSQEVSPTKRAAGADIHKVTWLSKTRVAKLSLANLTPKAIAQHRDERLKIVSTGTVLRDLAVIRSVINHARREWGFAIDNPVEKVRMPPAPRHRERVLSDDEEASLLEVLTPGNMRSCHGRYSKAIRTPWIKPMVILALETAMRRGELLRLTWQHVDLNRRVAYLPVTKNGTSRWVH